MSPSSDRRQFRHVILYSCAAAVGGFLFGFDSAVINGTVEALQEAFRTTSLGGGFSVASMLLGCAAGALAAGTIADRFGRRPVMFASAVAFLISALGSGWSGSASEFILYRLLGGLAVGAASVIAPAYIAEIAPARIRGGLASFQQLAIVSGIFVAFLSNYLIAAAAGGTRETWLAGQAAWSWMFWMEVLPSAAYIVLLLFIPESPRFLVAHDREQQAAGVLGRVVDKAEVPGLIASIKDSLHGQQQISPREVFKPGSWNLKTIVWIGIVLAVLQQLTGINILIYYGKTMWEASGFSEGAALLSNVVTGVINIVSTIIAITMIDKVGRKPLLLAGSAIMTLSLATVALAFAMGDVVKGQLVLSTGQGWIALIGANLFIVGFGTTWGPTVWVLLGEIFNNRIRGTAMALATFSLWMTNFVVTMSFLPLLENVGLSVTFMIFTGCMVFSFFFVWRFIDETKGKSLEVIGEEVEHPTGMGLPPDMPTGSSSGEDSAGRQPMTRIPMQRSNDV